MQVLGCVLQSLCYTVHGEQRDDHGLISHTHVYGYLVFIQFTFLLVPAGDKSTAHSIYELGEFSLEVWVLIL